MRAINFYQIRNNQRSNQPKQDNETVQIVTMIVTFVAVYILLGVAF